MESTRAISEYLIDICGDKSKVMIRRKDKKFFYIEMAKEIGDEEINLITEIFAQGEGKGLLVTYANKKIYKKYHEFIISK